MIRWPFTRKSPAKPSPQEQAAEDLRADMLKRRAEHRPWAEHRRSQLTGERRKHLEQERQSNSTQRFGRLG
jgi:hypothetical protein